MSPSKSAKSAPLRARLRAIVRRLLAELLTALALLLGWTLVTYACAGIWRPRIVWPLSAGLLLFSSAGWSLIRALVTDGLYALTKESPRA